MVFFKFRGSETSGHLSFIGNHAFKINFLATKHIGQVFWTNKSWARVQVDMWSLGWCIYGVGLGHHWPGVVWCNSCTSRCSLSPSHSQLPTTPAHAAFPPDTRHILRKARAHCTKDDFELQFNRQTGKIATKYCLGVFICSFWSELD